MMSYYHNIYPSASALQQENLSSDKMKILIGVEIFIQVKLDLDWDLIRFIE